MKNMHTQGRVLGIDYGTKRIGLSISDPLRIMALSYATVENNASVWENLIEIIRKEEVVLVVVGMPLTLKGEQGQKAREVNVFVEELSSKAGVETLTWDERFTTSIAQQSLRTMGTTQKQRRASKDRIDSMAAAVMLQGFLDSTKHSMNC
jgi:putative pre-16S rRNA nuclease